MALSQESRTALYQGLCQIVPKEAAEAMLSQFPSRDLDEPISKDHLRAELIGLKSELHHDIGELKEDMAGLKAELKEDMAGLKSELKEDMAGLKAELKGDIGDLRTELNAQLSRHLRWTIGTMIALQLLVVALVGLSR